MDIRAGAVPVEVSPRDNPDRTQTEPRESPDRSGRQTGQKPAKDDGGMQKLFLRCRTNFFSILADRILPEIPTYD